MPAWDPYTERHTCTAMLTPPRTSDRHLLLLTLQLTLSSALHASLFHSEETHYPLCHLTIIFLMSGPFQ